MRYVLLSILLGAGPAAGAVKVEREGSQTTYREESSAEHAAKASDKQRAFVLSGHIDEAGKKTCDQLFEEFHEVAIGDGEPSRIDVIGIVDCTATAPQGRATDFYFTYAFEPRKESDIPALEAFLKKHDGRRIHDAKLSYRRAFGVLVQASLEFYDEAVLDDPGEIFDTYAKERMFVNWRQAESWVLNAADQVEAPEIRKLVSWIERESDLSTAKFYVEQVLPDTRRITGSADVLYVLEDRSVVRAPLNFTMGVRDARKMPSGQSI